VVVVAGSLIQATTIEPGIVFQTMTAMIHVATAIAVQVVTQALIPERVAINFSIF